MNRDILLWDVAARQAVSTLKGNQNQLYRVSFSPDGQYLASTGVDPENITRIVWKETVMISSRNQLKSRIMIAVRGLAILLVVMILAFAFYLLFGGYKITFYSETPQSSEGPPLLQGVYSEPYLPALLYLIAAASLLVGLTSRERLFFAWTGLILLFAFSLCFLFSSGAMFIAFTAILLVLLIVIQWFKF